MKKIFVFLSLLFCGFVYADTITINWGVDNQTYTTTTCDVGGDVTLPTAPTKRGHTFLGWQAEHFNRGTFSNWAEVPTNTNGYILDVYENRTPVKNDIMTLTDASNYFDTDFLKDPDNIIVVKSPSSCTVLVSIENNTTSYYYTQIQNWFKLTDDISIRYIGGSPGRWHVKSDNAYYVNNIKKTGDTMILQTNAASWTTVYVSTKYNDIDFVALQGTWRFVYDGVWETDGKNGWKPDVQISSNSNE